MIALEDVGPLRGAAYLEAMKEAKRSVATQKQHMAAVRMLFDYLVTGGILEHNPILSLRAPRQSVDERQAPYSFGRGRRGAATLNRDQ